jgi:hypothetical protein
MKTVDITTRRFYLFYGKNAGKNQRKEAKRKLYILSLSGGILIQRHRSRNVKVFDV